MKTSALSIDASRKTVHQLLSSHGSITVPHYQRSFSWTNEETDEFWSDIHDVVLSGEQNYFFGSMVFIQKGTNDMEVVDGQQRLATVSLLFAVVRDAYEASDDKESKGIVESEYLCTRDLRTKTGRPVIVLNETDNSLFQQLVTGSSLEEIKSISNDTAKPESHRLLAKAYLNLREKVRVYSSDFAKKDALAEIVEGIADKLFIVHITTGDDDAAFVLFETLNDRGVDLSLADLLKNYLFSKAGARLRDFRHRWTEMSALIGQQRMTQFIRHDWMSHYGKIRERELYARIKGSLRTATQAAAYLEELRGSAEVYSALGNAGHEMWEKRPAQFRDNLRTINLFKIVQCFPLLMACQSEKVSFIEKVASWIVALSIRYSIIGGRGTGNLETILAKACTAVRKQKCKAEQVKTILKEIYPEDGEFGASFAAKTLTKPDIIRYLLGAIERRKASTNEVLPNVEELTVEHIFPKKPSADWDKIRAATPDIEDYGNRIGNLTLLDVPMNSRAANSGFDDKKKVYRTSKLAITNGLAKRQDWGVTQIEQRQKELASVAAEIWCF